MFPPLETYWPNLRTVSAPQAAFLLLDCLEAGYGGAAGGGKSDALLAGALEHVDRASYAALILRRTFADLALPGAAMARSHEWLSDRAHWTDREKTWTFPSGATLTFGYLQHAADVYRYQSSEFQFIGFDELTQFEEAQYRYLFSRLRRRSSLDVPLRMRWASNPGNIGHGWVKRKFIDQRDPGVVFIPAKVADNPGLVVDEYIESLSQLGDTLKAQLLDGDWGAFEGMAYTVKPDVHLVERVDELDGFRYWNRFESMDHGLSNPTAWLAYAVDTDGNAIVFDSHYEANQLPDHHATVVRERRRDFWERTDEEGWPQRHPCYGDPASIAERTHERDEFGDPMTIQDVYQRHGVRIVPANNRRRIGHLQVRQLLAPDAARRFPLWHPKAGELGAPRLFIVGERCPELVEQLQTAPLASGENDAHRGEAVDGKWEGDHGHAHASLRYGLTTWFRASLEPVPEPEDPRQAAMLRRRERTRKPASRYVDL